MSSFLWAVGIVLILGGAALAMGPRRYFLGALLVAAGIAAGPVGAVLFLHTPG